MFRLPWHELRPCFDLCAHVVHQRLPARYRLAISPKQKRLLTWVTYLSWVQASKRRGRVAKCSPSRRFLAGKLGMSIWTVTRYSNTLQALGLIDKRRLPFTGKTPTGQRWRGHNVYFPSGLLFGLLYRAIYHDHLFRKNGAPGTGPVPAGHKRTTRPRRDELTERWEEHCRQPRPERPRA